MSRSRCGASPACWASAWRGRPAAGTARGSLPTVGVERLLDAPGVRFHVLQQEAAAQEPVRRNWPVELLSPRTQRVEAAAAAMRQLDLVVSVDGMPAHLAATLGVPTWLLLKHDADWRWAAGDNSTPWYPSMRLFRQPAPGDWAGLVTQVATALAAWTAQPTAAQGARLPGVARGESIIR